MFNKLKLAIGDAVNAVDQAKEHNAQRAAAKAKKHEKSAIERGDYHNATVQELKDELAKQSAIANPEKPGLGHNLAATGKATAAVAVAGPLALVFVGRKSGDEKRAARKKVSAIQAALQIKLLEEATGESR